LQLTRRFFISLAGIMLLYSISFALPWLLPLAGFFLTVLVIALFVDILLLFSKSIQITASRRTTKMLSLGDNNTIALLLENRGGLAVDMDIFDELPYQLQVRNFHFREKLQAGGTQEIRYDIRPLKRGEYRFGYINAITSTLIGLAARRMQLGEAEMIPVYPSVIQMKKYELLAFARISTFEGVKKLRRIGHSYEFEQIKNYVQGDDIRSINWKATGRRSSLMVNQYEDERSQQVYTIIDKSRSMHMPFHGLSLLDYSVNTSLVISNIALKKYDKAGLITFSHAIGSTLKAESSELQLKKILNALYFEKPQNQEANYDLLYRSVKNVIRSRSLIFLYLNFESAYAMERALPVLKKINHLHLLVVMFFENTELIDYSKKQVDFVSDIYAQTIAQQLINEKKQIASRLRKNGIQVILSRPEDLSINTVNKYLELKARSLI
jgi:uncharacterized protein (DUF58 family)